MDGCTFVREADILRADNTLSRIMLRRKARLYTDRLELYHERDKLSPDLEVVANLRGSQVSEVHTSENDIKPTGTNLFVSYVYGSIHSTTLVCISRSLVFACTCSEIASPFIILAIVNNGNANDFISVPHYARRK
jgi:hypothetical protein